MFLFDDFVMTTKQQTNLKFLVCSEKFVSEALCTSLQKADFVSFNSFVLAQKPQKKEVRMSKMIPGVEGISPVEMKPISSL